MTSKTTHNKILVQRFKISSISDEKFLLVSLLICFIHRDLHPNGLPPSYTIILLFRLLPESPNDPFAIWQITDRDYKPQVGVIADRKDFYLILRHRCTYYWLGFLFSSLFKNLLNMQNGAKVVYSCEHEKHRVYFCTIHSLLYSFP